MTNQSSVRIDPASDGLVVRLADGSSETADTVINTLGRWCNHVAIPEGLPRLSIAWFKWRLLCLSTAKLPKEDRLDRVIMVVRKRSPSVTPSAIPHDGWITLDYKETPIRQVDQPEADQINDWRLLPAREALDEIDAGNLRAVEETFLPVRRLQARGLFSLAGIHTRLLADGTGAPVKPGSTHRLVSNDAVPGYFVSFGGQASTALLDAFDTLEDLAGRGIGEPFDRESLLTDLRARLSPKPYHAYRPMRWEQHT